MSTFFRLATAVWSFDYFLGDRIMPKFPQTLDDEHRPIPDSWEYDDIPDKVTRCVKDENDQLQWITEPEFITRKDGKIDRRYTRRPRPEQSQEFPGTPLPCCPMAPNRKEYFKIKGNHIPTPRSMSGSKIPHCFPRDS